ncbi:hypothetical protein B0H16DRAFT_1321039 [Mycena metata]|uniref:Fork-head domain-containing protein n=1 Tax=Mycena metata TaxID=1033252 RepID=A0AAD7N5F0_9AGAR|nr:hypothetical protein B0H16DRAFT_1321039 [Mycena metata]
MDPDQFLLEQRQLEHVLHRADPSTPANSALPPCAFHGPRVFPDPGDFLREKLHLPPGAPVDLWCVAEPADPATRPSAPYALLVTLAIYGTDKKRLTLQGLYREIANRFKYYRRQDALGIKSWRNSIRHALSLYALFINVPRPIPEPGKGEYWVLGDIHSDVLFTRLRKRNKKGAVTAKVEEDGDGSSRSDSSSDSRAPRKPRGRAERSAAPRKRRPTRAVSVDSDLNSECTSVCDSPSCMAESSATRVSTRIQYPSSTTVEGTGTKPSTKKGRRTRA